VAGVESSLVEWILGQSAAVVVGGVSFWVLLKEKRATEKRLVDLLRERKSDRDENLRMYGRLDSHLTRADLFDRVGKAALKELSDPKIPKRRASDRELLASIDDRAIEERR
jgi:hypothetical protein